MTASEPPRDRVRVPPPLVKRRLPTGRGATEQPNATSDGEAALTVRFWCAVVATGVATGLLGAGLMAVLFEVQRVGFDYYSGTFQAGTQRVSGLRRLAPLLVAGLVGGLAWHLLRRLTRGKPSEIDEALWNGSGRLSFRRSLGTSLISELVVGAGASLGREAGPKLMGGAAGSLLAGLGRLTDPQRRLLVACGAGAGLAAVYNVPLAGALFTVEVLCGAIAIPTVLPALACSGVATLTARLYLSSRASYIDIPSYHSSAGLIGWALLAGPLIGMLAAGYIRLIGLVSHHRATGAWSIAAMLGAFAVLGVIGLAYPQLFGNGKDLAHDAFVGHGAFLLLLALFLLKPLVTALCLASGASGGLLTPVMSSGALAGAMLGLAWSQLWPSTPVGAYALTGAAAAIGAAMQAPLAGLALVLELTHGGFALMIPMIVATVSATAVTRYLDGYSIYSARLPSLRP